MIIKAYLKPSCGWSNGVRAVLRKYALDFDDIDIIGDRASYAEMVRKSGQPLSPCVEVDGVMLADVSGEELENYLLSNDMVKPSDAAVGTATNAGCSDEEHAKMATKTIRFF
jgi:monothiol glutaredoxin